MRHHPTAIIIKRSCDEVNFRHRQVTIDKYKQSRGIWNKFKLNIYAKPLKTFLPLWLVILLLGAFSIKAVSLTTNNTFWNCASLLVWLSIFLLYLTSCYAILALVSKETEMGVLKRWIEVLNLSFPTRKYSNSTEVKQHLEGVKNYYTRKSKPIQSLISFLAPITLIFLADFKFLQAILTPPWTLSPASIWQASPWGTAFLLSLIISNGYYLMQYGNHIAWLDNAIARLELEDF